MFRSFYCAICLVMNQYNINHNSTYRGEITIHFRPFIWVIYNSIDKARLGSGPTTATFFPHLNHLCCAVVTKAVSTTIQILQATMAHAPRLARGIPNGLSTKIMSSRRKSGNIWGIYIHGITIGLSNLKSQKKLSHHLQNKGYVV